MGIEQQVLSRYVSNYIQFIRKRAGLFTPTLCLVASKTNAIKIMDTIISYHGFANNQDFLNRGGMEVFYFTQQYGVTRVGSVAASQSAELAGTDTCNNSHQPITYQGIVFTVLFCQDYTNIVFEHSSLPQWPIPQADLLDHSHFDASDNSKVPTAWACRGDAKTMLSLWSPTPRLTFSHSSSGVRYVSLRCGDGDNSNVNCGALYQDLPINRLLPHGRYLAGVSAKAVQRSGTASVNISIEQLGPGDAILSSEEFSGNVAAYNGTHPDMPAAEVNSVYRSAAFVHKVIELFT